MKTFNKYTVSEQHNGFTVENYLKQILQYSGRKVQKLTRKKGILLNGKTVYLQKKLKAKDTISVLDLEDITFGAQPEQGIIDILYEDDHLMVLNKPAYQLVHPAGQTNSGTLANFLACHLKQRSIMSTIRPVHRLDRDTSGCVIFAKDSHSQSVMEQQLKTGDLKRAYWALVQGTVSPSSGTIDAPIGPHPSRPNRRTVNKKGDYAVTHYQTIRSFEMASLLELNLETGRTHQIRVHLSHLGHPVIGDRMYGRVSPYINRQALHAFSVNFISLSDKNEVTVTAPIPEDFSQVVEFFAKSLQQ
ncbi:RluA family pseudouridine synthase [Phosphitispora sp. TUW77]|uniref:RluA family pseudouridine synthase n=1 Tax=Phosphitispora sp. TUW77 TaxID=3152361 RepID=UPI003AB7C5C2